ncbi:uncharacterized protein N7477_005876 [Penicillium maclennaniae]|uniref:uncharacterized protein n=1 Tax=Penicillium maclennaniae TaxID=1343394 RepID=UPI002540F180|nr:uncharacterized protein N7477_005876 [Penicillium maclennaniae]KAJ5670513.1 hypothetical protein N7477_005876 [Penicillium maclennaniae]
MAAAIAAPNSLAGIFNSQVKTSALDFEKNALFKVKEEEKQKWSDLATQVKDDGSCVLRYSYVW